MYHPLHCLTNMATATELGLRKSDIVTLVTSHEDREGGYVGVPLTTPGAKIDATIVEVLEATQGGATVKALASTEPTTPIGKEWHVWDGFHNYVGEGVERVNRELVEAGIVIQPVRDAERNITGVEVYNVHDLPLPQE
jgi:hypothetical protein